MSKNASVTTIKVETNETVTGGIRVETNTEVEPAVRQTLVESSSETVRGIKVETFVGVEYLAELAEPGKEGAE